MVLYAPFPLIWYATWPCSEKVLTFWHHPPGLGVDVLANISYHVAAFVIPLSLISNMTIYWNSWILTLWPQGWGGGICRQNVCYHVAAFLILFNLTCNMTMFWKSWILTLPPESTQEVGHRPSIKNHVWYVSYLLYFCLHVKFRKKYCWLQNLNT